MAAIIDHTNTQNPSQYRPGLVQNLTEITARLPTDELRAHLYSNNSARSSQSQKEDVVESCRSVPGHLILPPSSDSVNCQRSATTSMCALSRSSTGSLASIPISILPEGTAFWPGEQHCRPMSSDQKSPSHSSKSGKAHCETFQHDPKPRISSDIHEQQSLYLSSMRGSNLGPTFSLSPAAASDVEAQTPPGDAESEKHEAILHRRSRVSLTRKWVQIVSIFVALLALVALILILCFQRSKTMARAGFTVCTTLAYFCVAAGMWAANRTMVETFIAMNLVVVYGIFLNGQIDVFLRYATNV